MQKIHIPPLAMRFFPLRAGQQQTRQRHLPAARRCRNLITTMPPRTACAAPRRQRPANEPFSADIRKALGHTALGRHRHEIAIPYAPRCRRRRPQKGRKAMFLRHSRAATAMQNGPHGNAKRPVRHCKPARPALQNGPYRPTVGQGRTQRRSPMPTPHPRQGHPSPPLPGCSSQKTRIKM